MKLPHNKALQTDKVPITPGKLTGDILEAYHRGYLDGSDLAAWAEELIHAGFDSNSIAEALGNENLHWQEVPRLFLAICCDVGLDLETTVDVESIKKNAMIEEYRHGYRKGAELFQRFDDLRKSTGYPESIHFRLIEDSPSGTNNSGYYSDVSRTHGTELEIQVRKALVNAGINQASETGDK